jgi:hypothetical protein
MKGGKKNGARERLVVAIVLLVFALLVFSLRFLLRHNQQLLFLDVQSWLRGLAVASLGSAVLVFIGFLVLRRLSRVYHDCSLASKYAQLQELARFEASHDMHDLSGLLLHQLKQMASLKTPPLRHKKRKQLTEGDRALILEALPHKRAALKQSIRNGHILLRQATRISDLALTVIGVIFGVAVFQRRLQDMCDMLTNLLGILYFFTDELTISLNTLAFVFIYFPYDEGDNILLDGQRYSVLKISLWATTLLNERHQRTYVANWALCKNTRDDSIVNVSRSGPMSERIAVHVDNASSSREKLNKLQRRLGKFPDIYEGDFAAIPEIESISLKVGNTLMLSLLLQHAFNFADDECRQERTRNFLFYLQAELISLKMHIVEPPNDVNVEIEREEAEEGNGDKENETDHIGDLIMEEVWGGEGH